MIWYKPKAFHRTTSPPCRTRIRARTIPQERKEIRSVDDCRLYGASKDRNFVKFEIRQMSVYML